MHVVFVAKEIRLLVLKRYIALVFLICSKNFKEEIPLKNRTRMLPRLMNSPDDEIQIQFIREYIVKLNHATSEIPRRKHACGNVGTLIAISSVVNVLMTLLLFPRGRLGG